MLRTYYQKDLLPDALDLWKSVYKRMNYPTSLLHADAIFCVLQRDRVETETLGLLSVSPSAVDDYRIFTEAGGDIATLTRIHADHKVARIGSLAAAEGLTRKGLFELADSAIVTAHRMGFTFVIALVTPRHAKAWCRLYDFVQLTEYTHCEKYGDIGVCLGKKV